MKQIYTLIMLVMIPALTVLGQVGINADGSQPDPSAMLDVKSSSKGLLPPRMTIAQRNAIVSPVSGLLIYNSDCNDMQFFNGAGWVPMGNSGLLATPGSITGNASPCKNSAGMVYFIAPVAGATGYHWTVPPGASVSAGQGTVSITVNFGTVSGVICVAAYNDCYRSALNCLSISLVTALPVSVSNAASSNPACAGSTVTFTATPVNGGTTPAYQWYKNAQLVSGATNVAYSYIPANNDAVYCRMTSNYQCTTGNPATSNTVVMNMIALLPVSLTIAPSANPVCAGTSVIFTASPVNGGTGPTYQWWKNNSPVSGATNVTYTVVPVNGDQFKCVMTSNAICVSGNPATSPIITMGVNPIVTAGVTIVASPNPICAGSTITFTATPANGGSSPAYQWYKNSLPVGGATNVTYSYIPVNNDVVYCRMTSNAACVTGNPAQSNPITVVVTQPVTVSVSIAPNANPVCTGTSVTFTATPVNGGTTPQYQWFKNSILIAGATNITYAFVPVNNDAITCRLTSNASCITGNPALSPQVIMQVISGLPVTISITPSANPVCAGTSVTFSSTISNGGIGPLYQWKLNGTNISGATNPAYTYVPSNGNQISCTLTSNALCATGNPAASNIVTMTVNPLVQINATVKVVTPYTCGSSQATFIATSTNAGAGATYQWRVNSTVVPGATSQTFTTLASNRVDCQISSTIPCSTPGSAYTMPGGAVAQTPICYGEPIQLICNYTEGCNNPTSTFQWTNSSGSWQSSDRDPIINFGEVGYGSDVFYVTMEFAPPPGGHYQGWTCVTVNPVMTATINAVNATCYGMCNGTANLVPGGGTPPYTYLWSNGSTSQSLSGLCAGSYTVTVTDSRQCQFTRSTVIGSPTLVSVSGNTTSVSCYGNCNGAVNLSVAGGTPPYTHTWSNGATTMNLTNLCTGTYSVTVRDAQNCQAVNAWSVLTPALLAVNPTPVNVTCYGSCNGSVSLTVTGGTPPYFYQWSNGASTQNISGLCSTTYSVTVTDSHLCTVATSSSVGFPTIASPAEGIHVATTTQIIWNWFTVAGATGYKWNTVDNYATAIDMGTATTKTETGLIPGTPYTRYVWAYKPCSVSFSTPLHKPTAWVCGSALNVSHTAGAVAPVSKTIAYGTVTNIPGENSKCWITSNLGADHQATSVSDATEPSAGWYWQFNRKQGFKHDGATRTPNTTWITSINESLNWESSNDPCILQLGNGWRLPTGTEWTNVDASGGWTNWNGPFNSALKLHAAGNLNYFTGNIGDRGTYGDYWSTTQSTTTDGSYLTFSNTNSYFTTYYKTNGFPLRCIKD